MTPVCPNGHESQTTDYCDQCGVPIGAGPGAGATAGPGAGAAAGPGAGATAVLPVVEELDTSPSARREPCPACGAARSGDDRYCEGCGHDFESPPPPAAAWEAVATADRAQFDRLATAGVTFPEGFGERRFPLREGENRIGRSRGAPGADAPEIDLAAPPSDPGVSRLHAVLECRPDGTCALRDLGSTNGTTVGEDPAPIAPQTEVPLSDGARIHVGAWTMITVRRAQKS
jgi:FHA domain